MPLRTIVIYGHPVLRQKSAPVEEIDGDVLDLVDDMIETMHGEPGIGLAANQVGVARRVAVIDVSVGRDPNALMILINPEIVEQDGHQQEEEGCLSIPGVTATVERPYRVLVRAQDRDGSSRVITGEGLMARALCHEIDHLDGILFTDRISGLKRRSVQKQVQRLLQSV